MGSKAEALKRFFGLSSETEVDRHPEFRDVETAIDEVLKQNRIATGPIPVRMHSNRFDFGHELQTYFFEEIGFQGNWNYRVRLTSEYELSEHGEKLHGIPELSLIDAKTMQQVVLKNGEQQAFQANKRFFIQHAKSVVEGFIK